MLPHWTKIIGCEDEATFLALALNEVLQGLGYLTTSRSQSSYGGWE